MANPKA